MRRDPKHSASRTPARAASAEQLEKSEGNRIVENMATPEWKRPAGYRFGRGAKSIGEATAGSDGGAPYFFFRRPLP